MSNSMTKEKRESSPLFYAALTCLCAFWAYNAGRRAFSETFLESLIPEYILFMAAMMGTVFILFCALKEYLEERDRLKPRCTLKDLLIAIFSVCCGVYASISVLGKTETLGPSGFWVLAALCALFAAITCVQFWKLVVTSLLLQPSRR